MPTTREIYMMSTGGQLASALWIAFGQVPIWDGKEWWALIWLLGAVQTYRMARK